MSSYNIVTDSTSAAPWLDAVMVYVVVCTGYTSSLPEAWPENENVGSDGEATPVNTS